MRLLVVLLVLLVHATSMYKNNSKIMFIVGMSHCFYPTIVYVRSQ